MTFFFNTAFAGFLCSLLFLTLTLNELWNIRPEVIFTLAEAASRSSLEAELTLKL